MGKNKEKQEKAKAAMALAAAKKEQAKAAVVAPVPEKPAPKVVEATKVSTPKKVTAPKTEKQVYQRVQDLVGTARKFGTYDPAKVKAAFVEWAEKNHVTGDLLAKGIARLGTTKGGTHVGRKGGKIPTECPKEFVYKAEAVKAKKETAKAPAKVAAAHA